MAERFCEKIEQVAQVMMLFERMMSPVTLWTQERLEDGEGGYTSRWTQGETFDAVCICNSSNEQQRAEKQQAQDTYTVTTCYKLAFDDVFVRNDDGTAFRVTSNGNEGATPEVSTFEFRQYSAVAFDFGELLNDY